MFLVKIKNGFERISAPMQPKKGHILIPTQKYPKAHAVQKSVENDKNFLQVEEKARSFNIPIPTQKYPKANQ